MTGIDAMVHAIEAYTSRHKKNAISDALALRGLHLLSANVRNVLAAGENLDARRAMLTGAMLAGMAFANAPVAAVHALAYPLGGRFHVPHGLSNALVLLPVLEFNLPNAEVEYGELAAAIGAGNAGGASPGRPLVDAMAVLLAEVGLERTLRDVGVSETDLPMLASDAMAVQRLLINNPREVRYEDALAIYTQVL
jgi:alcohol dehydrogenase class IV